MQVKKIYMDLQEAKEDGNRWRLESKAFKDPLTIEIAYDDSDKRYIEECKQTIQLRVEEVKRIQATIQNTELAIRQLKEEHRKVLETKNEKIEELTKRLEKAGKEKVQLVRESNKIRETVERQNEQLATLGNELAEIKQKLTKQPRVYSGQTFVSGNGPTGLTTIRVADGNYVVIWNAKITEKNEYVENADREQGGYNIHVTDGVWVPEYDLRGTTALDTPTATVDRTFTLIPS